MSNIKDLHKKWMKDPLYRQEYEALVAVDIKRGLADMKAGRVIPHDEAMRKARQAIEIALEEKP